MAKYTELLSEYLEGGGTLPSNFSLIYGFEDLFKIYFCDKEIGFETEELFALKLEAYAQMLVPLYAERISDLATAVLKARTPSKTYYEHYATTINAGAQKGKVTELPFNSTTAQPNSITESEAYSNSDARTTDRAEAGLTVTEAYMQIDELNKQVGVIVLKLLKEFDKHCFMQVY